MTPRNEQLAEMIREEEGHQVKEEFKSVVMKEVIYDMINEGSKEAKDKQNEYLEQEMHLDITSTNERKPGTRVKSRKRKSLEEDKAPSNEESNLNTENVVFEGEGEDPEPIHSLHSQVTTVTAASIAKSKPTRKRKAPGKETKVGGEQDVVEDEGEGLSTEFWCSCLVKLTTLLL